MIAMRGGLQVSDTAHASGCVGATSMAMPASVGRAGCTDDSGGLLAMCAGAVRTVAVSAVAVAVAHAVAATAAAALKKSPGHRSP